MSRELLLSSSLQESITKYHLGVPFSEHRSKQALMAVRISLLQGLPMLIVGVSVLWIREQVAKAPAFPISLGWLFSLALAIFMCSVAVVGFSSFTLIKSSAHLHDRVIICTGGLLCLYGKKSEAVRWDEIVEVWETTQYTIVRADETKYTFPILTKHLSEGSSLRAAIARETIARLLPQAIRQLDEGKIIRFGKYSLSKDTLSDPWKSIPWKEITDFKMHDEHFFYQRVGVQREIHFADASAPPNSFLFLALVQCILELK